jgi:hypothetical protein
MVSAFHFCLLAICLHVGLTRAQYYRPPPVFNNDYSSGSYGDAAVSSNDENLNEIEQKYVNGGQSVVLICDLPNSMPDGKVRI